MLRNFVLFIFLATSLFSCGDEDDNTTNTVSDSFECSIDGSAYKITGANAYAQKIAADLFTIYGSEDAAKPGFKTVYISLVKEPTVGKYDLSTNVNGNGNILETSSGILYNSNFLGGTGALEVTEKTANRIKGTFSFTGATAIGTKKQVTGGKFDVKIK